MALASPPSPLTPYVPRIAAEWGLDAPDLPWQVVDGTLCFADVSGFTRLSERLAARGRVGAEELTEILGRVFGSMLELAHQRGGNLLKFGGDALLLLFRGHDHAVQAACAAVAMRSALREATSEPTSVGPVTLRMSQGLHSGLIHLFSVGRSHGELIVTGPGASATTDMEKVADAGEIVVSTATRAALPAGAAVSAKGPGWLLRWRQPHLPPGPPEPRRWVEASAIDARVPVVLREHLRHGTASPEHRIATVGFVKFVGIDALMASGGPAPVAEALGELVDTVQDVLEAEGVTLLASDIDQDGGKLILATGVPNARDDDEGRMLRAVRRIVDAPVRLRLKVGVNRGHVFAGEVGNRYRRTYTVMGDTVNLAARLMAQADPGQILTTADVLARSQTSYDAVPLPPFFVKGKLDPVQASSVGAVRTRRAAAPAADVRPLIGRDREIDEVMAAWASARAGSGRMVELVGDPGIGKTRLLEEVLARVGDAVTLRSECRVYQSSTPYFPFRTLLSQALGLEGLAAPEAEARLQQVVDDVAPELRPWLSLIGAALDLGIEPSEEVRLLEHRFRKVRLEDAVMGLLAAVLTTPAVVVIEDAHHIDDASKDLLAGRADDVGELPWLVCVTRRQVDGGFHAPEGPAVVRLELAPLDPTAAAVLIHAETDDDPLMPQQVQTLADRAEGNPLFLYELLSALRAGALVGSLPESVEGLIEVRIDRLPPRDRTALRNLSVLGSSFSSAYAHVVLGADQVVGDTLASLDDFLTVDATGRVRFRHGLTRDVAYEGLPFRTRRQLHAAVAESIRAAGGDADRSELLSVHYFAAGRWEEAWRYARDAADAAQRVYAGLDAATLLERAVAAGARLPDLASAELAEAWAALGRVREQVGRFADALQALRVAARLVGTDEVARAELHLQRALVICRTGAYTSALRETAIGLRLLDGLDTADARRTRPRLLALRGQLRIHQGRPREALLLGLRAVDEARAGGQDRALAEAFSLLDWTYEMLGRPEDAVHGTKALEIYESMGDLPGVAVVTGNMGVEAYAAGRWDDAVRHYTRAQEAFRRSGNEAHAAHAEANVVEVLVSQGRLAEAEPLARHAMRVLRAHNAVAPRLFAEMQLARLLLYRGDLHDAITALARVMAEATAIGHATDALEAAVHLADAHVRLGHPEGALELLTDAERAAADAAAMYAAPVARVRVAALCRCGMLPEAEAQLARGLEAARSQRLLYEEALLRAAHLDLAALRGEEPDVEDVQEAERLLRILGVERR